MLVGEEFVVAFTRSHGRDDGEEVEVMFADAFRFDRQGRLCEYWTLPADVAARDAVLS